MKKTILVLLISVASLGYIYAQGCSDAGFCTAGSLQDATHTEMDKQLGRMAFGAGLGYEIGETEASYLDINLKASLRLSNRISWENKLVYTFINGEDKLGTSISASGLGDLFSVFNVNLSKTKKSEEDKKEAAEHLFGLVFGVKIPFNNSNLKQDNSPLPMPFQTSLGTYDLIAGLSYVINKNFGVNVGLQYPLTANNKNEYLGGLSGQKFEFDEKEIPSTNKFSRQPDVLFRVTNYNTFGKWSLKPNLLLIYHLGEDSYTSSANVEQKIKGSDGLTINFGAIVERKISAKQSFELIFGVPLQVRDVRPDGLTRSVVVALNFNF